MKDPFIRDKSDYKRKTDILPAYVRDMSLGLARKFNISEEEAKAFVVEEISQNGTFPLIDKPTLLVAKNEHGDREYKETTFLGYLNTARNNDYILSPSLQMYEAEKRVPSISGKYLTTNIAARSTAKNQMYANKEAGDLDGFYFKNNEQQNKKYDNNSISGAHCSKSTILFKPTIHTSLTSLCRCASGYGNANNEKVLSGKRHYWSPDIVEANILAICTNSDANVFNAFMTKWNIVIPTVQDVMDCITRSTVRYFNNPKRMIDIERLVSGLNPIERAMVVYTGDMYHVAKLNKDFIHDMITKFSRQAESVDDIDVKAVIHELFETAEVLLALLCGDLLNGLSLKGVNELPPESQRIIAGTAINLKNCIEEYEFFIKAIFATDVIPASIATLPTVVRENAVTSDTDSTIFTVQEWLEWYYGKICFDKPAVNAGHVVAFFASSSITNILAIMSKNIGVNDKHLFSYAMKSEYWFPVFCLTSRAKTYFGIRGAQEGIILSKKLEIETKGAVLKGSNTPEFIISAVNKAKEEILLTVRDGKKINLLKYLTECADLERYIIAGINRGDVSFYKRGDVKPASSYKKDELNSPYRQYTLWQEVFAPKYGNIQEPPYAAIKVTLESEGSKPKFLAWLNGIEDASLVLRMKEHLAKTGKEVVTQILVPIPIANNNGVPPELLEGMGMRKIVNNLMEPYYVILETLGYYAREDNNLRLVSDYY